MQRCGATQLLFLYHGKALATRHFSIPPPQITPLILSNELQSMSYNVRYLAFRLLYKSHVFALSNSASKDKSLDTAGTLTTLAGSALFVSSEILLSLSGALLGSFEVMVTLAFVNSTSSTPSTLLVFSRGLLSFSELLHEFLPRYCLHPED
ncbi:hypothetical protein HBH98_152570 [Parastagonospora nodorum]|nr:hypothetical protein HBH53_156160 [Parastagonospora nodorum]KAH4063267.1 hypothetical protein HBH50_194600 [Parastagonospora nodorum]KAH4082499.1 hypothetical protein HBH48_187080 [Parastagonospora nodorum]KAH4201785.1 hypothetical protein HBI95_163170 [Parastagonospora nodorum]KAH4216283.1 hypothetical protein HBI06_233250 [Parastagonospora nodorum]